RRERARPRGGRAPLASASSLNRRAERRALTARKCERALDVSGALNAMEVSALPARERHFAVDVRRAKPGCCSVKRAEMRRCTGRKCMRRRARWESARLRLSDLEAVSPLVG